MRYAEFQKQVAEKGWTITELRCDDAPTSEELLAFMEKVGIERYERYVLQMQLGSPARTQ